MIIANPIYDIVFKKLMEDRDIARGVLERILGTEIDQLAFASQEHTAATEDGRLTFFRLDFIANIREKNGEWKRVLIELQKARLTSDVDRFRAYLATEYRRVSEVPRTDGGTTRQGLPIITIYFFGYLIDKRLPGAFKIDRRYIDLITGEELSARSEVMERLTHDAYAVQIPALGDQQRNEVEELLAIFRQEHLVGDLGHLVAFDEDHPPSDLLQRILRMLTYLAAEPDIQRKMDVEDEMYFTLSAETAEAERRAAEAERQLADAERRLAEEQRQREEAEQQCAEEQRQREEAQAEVARLLAMLHHQDEERGNG